jgi:hypothetical protein
MGGDAGGTGGSGGSGGTGGTGGAGGGTSTQSFRVFTSAITLLPSFGGASAADRLCDAAAADAGLSGHHVAWVSTPDAGPLARFPSGLTGQWLLVGAGVAFVNFSQLSLQPSVPIDRDEHGRQLSGTTWTGTLNGGASSGATCGNWSNASSTGTYGSVVNTVGWTNANAPSLCASPRHLYCFQVR